MRVGLPPIPLLAAAIGVIGANSLVLAPIAPAVAADIACDVSMVLRAAAAYGAGTAVSALVLAPRADVIGSDKALRRACLLLLVALVLSMVAPNVLVLIIGQALAGLGAGIALPAIYSLAAQIAPKGREKQTIGSVLTGWTLSLIGGVTLAALLTDLAGWRFVYAIMAMSTALIWLLLGHTDLKTIRLTNRATSPFSALRFPGVLRGLMSNAMLMLAFNGAYIYMGAHIVENLGMGTTAAGIITMFYGAGFGVAVVFLRHLEVLPQKRIGLLAFLGLSCVYLAMNWNAAIFLVLLPIAFVWGIFQHFALNTVVDRLTSLDPSQRGAIMGLNSAVTYLTVMGGAILYHYPYSIGGLAACVAFSTLFAVFAVIEALWPQRVRTCSPAE